MSANGSLLRIGVISDTHGLLRPEAQAALRGSDALVHAGDIGGAGIIEALSSIAPVAAVRGNNDQAPWAQAFPQHATVEYGAARIFLIHDRNELQWCPAPSGCNVVVTGHSHRPLIERRNGVLYLNPGSAGPRRFRLPVTVALLHVGTTVEAEIVALPV